MACRYAKQYICAEIESQKWPVKREEPGNAWMRLAKTLFKG
jgi:hypothetical protein